MGFLMRSEIAQWGVLIIIVCLLVGTNGLWVTTPGDADGFDENVDLYPRALPNDLTTTPDGHESWTHPGPYSGSPTIGPSASRCAVHHFYELPFDPDVRAYLDTFNRIRPLQTEPSPIGPPGPFDLEDLLYLEDIDEVLDLTDEQRAFLEENYMVGTSNTVKDLWYFSEGYQYLLEGWQLPTFITSDSVVDAFHLMFEDILIDLEETLLTEQAIVFSENMMLLADAQRDALPEEGKYLAEGNVAFFGAALRLLEPEAVIPDYAEEDVTEICSLIENATGFHPVPGFEHSEDFTQYKPRGHYTQSEELERYFRALMWYGRITFRGDDLEATQRAVLASLALTTDAFARDSYHYLTKAIDYLVGPPDDLTCLEYADAVSAMIGKVDTDYKQVLDEDLVAGLQEYLKDYRPPRIQSGLSFPGKPEWGLRIIGQRTVPDSYIFTQCTFDRLPSRMMPTVLDVMAVLGSDKALSREDFTCCPELEDRLGELRDEMEELPESTYDDTAYWGWLHSLQALHEEVESEDLPEFMGTDAWEAKQLNAQAASWTQLTHDTCLYRKQSYSSLTCVPRTSWFVYVEPVPDLYSRMERLVDNMRTRLSDLDLLSEATSKKLDRFSTLLSMLHQQAVQELDGTDPSEWNMRGLSFYHDWLTSLYTDRPKTVVVSDVHTDPNSGTCLQEGVGTLKFIVVAVPYGDGHVACVGVVFQHHEFVRSLSDGRLTDEEWKEMLEDGTAPEPAPWAADFIL